MAGKSVMNPNGESATVILINGHGIEVLPKYLSA